MDTNILYNNEPKSTPDLFEPQLPKLLLAWFMERFPPSNLLPCFMLFFTVWYYSGNYGNEFEITINLCFELGLKFFALVVLFLIMRIIDEHKDFSHDAVHFPERVLHQTPLTLAHLRKVGYFASIFILLAHVDIEMYLNTAALTSFLVLSAWLILMTKEFFVKQWLAARPLTYASSHMLIMPLMSIWLITLLHSTNAEDLTFTELKPVHQEASLFLTALYFSGFTFFGGFAGEIFRKFRSPEELSTYVDAYNHIHSDRFLLIVGASSLTLMAGFSGLLIDHHSSVKFHEALLLNISFLMFVGATLMFWTIPVLYQLRPSRQLRKIVTAIAAFGILLVYGALFLPLF